MNDYIEVITNAQTGEVTHRPMTEAEIAALQPTIEQLAAEARAQRHPLRRRGALSAARARGGCAGG